MVMIYRSSFNLSTTRTQVVDYAITHILSAGYRHLDTKKQAPHCPLPLDATLSRIRLGRRRKS